MKQSDGKTVISSKQDTNFAHERSEKERSELQTSIGDQLQTKDHTGDDQIVIGAQANINREARTNNNDENFVGNDKEESKRDHIKTPPKSAILKDHKLYTIYEDPVSPTQKIEDSSSKILT